MWPDRRLIDVLQIEHPIVLSPMTGFGTVDLAAASAELFRRLIQSVEQGPDRFAHRSQG